MNTKYFLIPEINVVITLGNININYFLNIKYFLNLKIKKNYIEKFF